MWTMDVGIAQIAVQHKYVPGGAEMPKEIRYCPDDTQVVGFFQVVAGVQKILGRGEDKIAEPRAEDGKKK
jgi:hypothetical protein